MACTKAKANNPHTEGFAALENRYKGNPNFSMPLCVNYHYSVHEWLYFFHNLYKDQAFSSNSYMDKKWANTSSMKIVWELGLKVLKIKI
jgi:hypothetical protein